LHLGVLIIGSLFWDVDGEKKKHRKDWQRERLDMTQRLLVRAPIRYGRKSSKRDNTFTMVFSQLCRTKSKLGQALVIPFKNQVSSANDLILEAKRLWSAEQSTPEEAKAASDALGASWGCVALLQNPKGQKLPREWRERWKTAVAQDKRLPYGRLKHASGEISIVNRGGVLKIRWPKPLTRGNLVPSLDAIIATATNPCIQNGRYHSPKMIARAWKRAKEEHVQYFWKNREGKIWTFEDDAIKTYLT